MALKMMEPLLFRPALAGPFTQLVRYKSSNL